MTLGERIKNRREELGLSQTELAERCGVKTPNAVSRWENDKTEPGLETIGLISQALHVSVEYLLALPNTSEEENPDNIYSEEEKSLISDFRCLDEIGQQVIRSVMASQVDRCEQRTSQYINEVSAEKREIKEPIFLSKKDPEYKECRERVSELRILKKKAFIDSPLLTEFLWQEGYNKKISIADIALVFSGWKVPSRQLADDIKEIFNKRIANQNAE